MTPEHITAERARLAKLRELNMPEPGAERLLAHIDAMTAAVRALGTQRYPYVSKYRAAVLAILEGK
jgi:hypothetical protein